MSAQTPDRSNVSFYVHGTSEPEQRRLSKLNDLLNTTSLEALGLNGGERILDVGSGLGQLACAMARAAGPGGRVIGIERSAEQLDAASRFAAAAGSTVEFRPGDALALPLRDDEWRSFDIAHTRFLLEHVPDPLAVVRSMVRAVKPGGRIVLEDDDHEVLRVWPEPAGLMQVWRAYQATYAANGNDPYIGRRLVQLLVEAGVTPRSNRWIFFGGCSGNPDFPAYVENLATVLEGARHAILATDLTSPAEVDRVVGDVRAMANVPDAAFWYARCWAEGIVS